MGARSRGPLQRTKHSAGGSADDWQKSIRRVAASGQRRLSYSPACPHTLSTASVDIVARGRSPSGTSPPLCVPSCQDRAATAPLATAVAVQLTANSKTARQRHQCTNCKTVARPRATFAKRSVTESLSATVCRSTSLPATEASEYQRPVTTRCRMLARSHPRRSSTALRCHATWADRSALWASCKIRARQGPSSSAPRTSRTSWCAASPPVSAHYIEFVSMSVLTRADSVSGDDGDERHAVWRGGSGRGPRRRHRRRIHSGNLACRLRASRWRSCFQCALSLSLAWCYLERRCWSASMHCTLRARQS
jgi:hypothetical protein